MNFVAGDLIAHKSDTEDVYLIVEVFQTDILGNTIMPEARTYYKMLRLSDSEIYKYRAATIDELSVKIG